jgi:hypothetical protein
MRTLVTSLILAALAVGAPAVAENHVQGALVVEGKSIPMTQVYAHARPGFFDKSKQDVVVLFCDAAVPAAAQRDEFARGELVKAGKLHCVQQTIDAGKQVINFSVEHNRFKMNDSGGSTYHVFEAKTFDGKTVAGRARTTQPQKSFDDVPYSYDLTFSVAIAPK